MKRKTVSGLERKRELEFNEKLEYKIKRVNIHTGPYGLNGLYGCCDFIGSMLLKVPDNFN